MTQEAASLLELVERMRAANARLPWEVGAFISLEVAEHLLRRPCPVDLGRIRIGPEGELGVQDQGLRADEPTAARAFVQLLARLLVAAGTDVPQHLITLSERGLNATNPRIRDIKQDIERALVPLNRPAMRRLLARLFREHMQRLSQPAALRASIPIMPSEEDDLDRLLSDDEPSTVVKNLSGLAKEAMGGRVSSLPEAVASRPEYEESVLTEIDEDVSDTLIKEVENTGHTKPDRNPIYQAIKASRDGRISGVSRSSQPAARPSTRSQPRADVSEHAIAVSKMVAEGTHPRRESRHDSIEHMWDAERKRVGWGRWVLLMLFIAAGAVGYVYRTQVGALYQHARQTIAKQAAPPVRKVPVKKPIAIGEIVLAVEPASAQVLLFAGKAPVEVEDVPVGMTQEFVATIQNEPTAGAAASETMLSRVLLAGDAVWQKRGERSFYELAIQLDKKEDADFGKSLLTEASGGGLGSEVGIVRVVTSPQGASVYQTVGFAPEARLFNLSLAHSYEFLIVSPGYEPQTLVVAPGDFVEQAGQKSVRREIKLRERIVGQPNG